MHCLLLPPLRSFFQSLVRPFLLSTTLYAHTILTPLSCTALHSVSWVTASFLFYSRPSSRSCCITCSSGYQSVWLRRVGVSGVSDSLSRKKKEEKFGTLMFDK